VKCNVETLIRAFIILCRLLQSKHSSLLNDDVIEALTSSTEQMLVWMAFNRPQCLQCHTVNNKVCTGNTLRISFEEHSIRNGTQPFGNSALFFLRCFYKRLISSHNLRLTFEPIQQLGEVCQAFEWSAGDVIRLLVSFHYPQPYYKFFVVCMHHDIVLQIAGFWYSDSLMSFWVW
jgi:hypothetical protein